MSKFESSIKQIPYSQEAVYRSLSDLSNLERVRERVPEDKVKNFTFDQDTITMNVPPVGEISMHIIEREEPKCIKFETTKSPLPFNFWIQLLPVIKADINPFIKGMVSKPLKEGLEKIAEALAMIRYE